MKYLQLFFFFILVSCVTSKKTYLCGDVKCKNNKEIRKLFERDLSIEISVKNKIDETVDLVELNKDKKITINNQKDSFFGTFKNPIKNTKLKYKKNIDKKNNIKKIQPIVKKLKSDKLSDYKTKDLKKNISKVIKQNTSIKNTKKKCFKLKDCNEEEILDYFNNKAKIKDYPDITSN
jgi:hypothetical protein